MSFAAASGPAPEPMADPVDPALLLGAMDAFFDRWQGAHPRLNPMVGPSAPQRCSHELMEGLAGLARRRGALFHTHVLETKTQIAANLERYGRSSVDYLDDLGLLSSAASLAHCVWMDPGEFDSVRRRGATVVHNPVSNLRCGSGLLPVADLLEAGVSVALGADGAASNDNQNMFEAMKFACLMQTLHGSHRRWPQAPAVWEMGLRGGAAALGQPLGSLRPGSKADVVLLSTDRHVPVDRDGLATSLVLAEHGQSVHTVIVEGEVAVSAGRSVRVDEAEANRRSLALQERIHSALPERQALYEKYADVLTEVHDDAMARPAPVKRLADITPAFGPRQAAEPIGGGAERDDNRDGEAERDEGVVRGLADDLFPQARGLKSGDARDRSVDRVQDLLDVGAAGPDHLALLERHRLHRRAPGIAEFLLEPLHVVRLGRPDHCYVGAVLLVDDPVDQAARRFDRRIRLALESPQVDVQHRDADSLQGGLRLRLVRDVDRPDAPPRQRFADRPRLLLDVVEDEDAAGSQAVHGYFPSSAFPNCRTTTAPGWPRGRSTSPRSGKTSRPPWDFITSSAM